MSWLCTFYGTRQSIVTRLSCVGEFHCSSIVCDFCDTAPEASTNSQVYFLEQRVPTGAYRLMQNVQKYNVYLISQLHLTIDMAFAGYAGRTYDRRSSVHVRMTGKCFERIIG